MKNYKENHGKVGEALYIKMTLDKFNEKVGDQIAIPDKTELTTNELGEIGVVASVPVIIDEATQGDYEVVCEDGVEIHFE